MHKLKSVAGVALALLAFTANAEDKITPKVTDALAFAPPGSVNFHGWIGEAMATCKTGRIFAQSLPDLINPFAVREEDRMWRGEFWGKWFTSVALAYRYDGDPKLRAILDEAVKGLIATQTPDGGITTYKAANEFTNWDTWGRKYTLLGLLAYHDLTGDAKALDAARKHADRVLSFFGPGKADIATNGWWTGMAASSIMEPMVLLHRRTGERRYLDFVKYIVRAWEGPKGPDLVRKALDGIAVFKMFPGPDPTKKGYMSWGSSKSYEMMSCYEGLVELHRVTGEPKYLEAARKVFANIRDTEITILGSGSSWERWCNGRMRQAEPLTEWMETCVTVTWMKFATQLLRLTGDPLYADEIERSALNSLLATQKDDGTWWSHFSALEGRREPAPEHCKMHQNCCVASGPRGLNLLPALAVMRGSSGPVVNFYEPATVKFEEAQLDIKSDYPRANVVDITVRPTAAKEFTLSLRIPAWSRATKLTVNGKTISDIKPGSYARLTRTWKNGDKVRLTLDFAVRCEKDPGGSGRVAITRGPVVFALDKRVTKPAAGNGVVVADASGVVKATVVKAKGVQMALDVPFDAAGKKMMLRFCDYASSGHTWKEDSTLRVWLPQPLDLFQPFAGIHVMKKE
ncbi:MAG: glycoside hydrolase family 127 protein [Verrucomicrobia bacterium]|nr:glycoside hydrolase family 127 protein [Verrucomicrobiota bacterium]